MERNENNYENNNTPVYSFSTTNTLTFILKTTLQSAP